MPTYEEAKNAYIKNHLCKDLKQPIRRINALKAIEVRIKNFYPDLLQANKIFKKYDRSSFSIR